MKIPRFSLESDDRSRADVNGIVPKVFSALKYLLIENLTFLFNLQSGAGNMFFICHVSMWYIVADMH